jgi:hypothetical protein
MKRTVPLVITFTVGALLIVAYFIPHWPFARLRDDFNTFFDVIAAFAYIVGGGNLIRMHGRRAARQEAGWGYSLVCLAGFLAMLAFGLTKVFWREGAPGWDLQGDLNDSTLLFKRGYDNIFRPCSATFYALLAFFIASASYRAFRARNVEATLLLVTALVILLGRTFVGTLMTGWLPPSLEFLSIPQLSNWIMSVPNQAGNRAIMIGVALGIVSLSLKVILGIDRSHLGEKD